MLPPTEITADAALRDLGNADPRVREQAAAALGSAGQEDRARVVLALRVALKDDIGAVRYAAALSLGELEDAGAVAALCDQLGDGDPMARQAAAIALGRIGAKAAFEPLVRALQQGPAEVRFQAVASLAELDPVRAFDALLGALQDTDAEVRGAAAAALGDHGDQRARDPLAALLADADASCRFEAACALARLGDRRAITTLVELIDDRDFSLLALQGLTTLRAEKAREQARRLMGRVFRPEVQRVRAAAVLASLGDSEGRAFLQKRVSHRREDVRGLTIQALGEIGDEWALDLLRELRVAARDDDQRALIDEAMSEALRGGSR
jgi:HEAT repeat protein